MKDAKQIVLGFPVALRDDVDAVAAVLPEPTHVLEARAQRVSVQGEEIEIAARLYNREPVGSAIKRLNDVQRLIAACVYSRHHDGYVRQSACAAILPSTEPWVVPYVVQLLGEYVVEISSLILERLTAQSSWSSSSPPPGSAWPPCWLA